MKETKRKKHCSLYQFRSLSKRGDVKIGKNSPPMSTFWKIKQVFQTNITSPYTNRKPEWRSMLTLFSSERRLSECFSVDQSKKCHTFIGKFSYIRPIIFLSICQHFLNLKCLVNWMTKKSPKVFLMRGNKITEI